MPDLRAQGGAVPSLIDAASSRGQKVANRQIAESVA